MSSSVMVRAGAVFESDGRHGVDEPPTEIDIGEVTADTLEALLTRAEQGEEIVLVRDGQPVAMLLPPPPRPHREPGIWRGQVVIHDDFDELPPEIRDAFEGRES